MKKNLDKLKSFHHGAIRRILNIKWNQVREDHIKNKEIRKLLFNIPNIDAYINKRTAAYIGKVTRSNNDSYPKKFLAAWINTKKKKGPRNLPVIITSRKQSNCCCKRPNHSHPNKHPSKNGSRLPKTNLIGKHT
jgi:hypothetical protein